MLPGIYCSNNTWNSDMENDMNRDIKFRALVQYAGKDPYWEYYEPLTIPYGFKDSGEGFSKIIVKNLEYTGLKDKNGDDVYEGDIIESTILGIKFKGEVFWETAGWRVKGDDLDITLGHDKAKTRKIIGNIWENPELLTEGEK